MLRLVLNDLALDPGDVQDGELPAAPGAPAAPGGPLARVAAFRLTHGDSGEGEDKTRQPEEAVTSEIKVKEHPSLSAWPLQAGNSFVLKVDETSKKIQGGNKV